MAPRAIWYPKVMDYKVAGNLEEQADRTVRSIVPGGECVPDALVGTSYAASSQKTPASASRFQTWDLNINGGKHFSYHSVHNIAATDMLKEVKLQSGAFQLFLKEYY